jgi:zinc protease
MGTIDPGMLVVSGRVKDGVDLLEAEKEVDEVVQSVVSKKIEENELQKVKNQSEASLEFGEVEIMNRAMNLAFASLSGDTNLANQEAEKIESVTIQDIHRVASEILKEENSSTMHYKAIK